MKWVKLYLHIRIFIRFPALGLTNKSNRLALANHFEIFYSRPTVKVNKRNSLIECNRSTFRLSIVETKSK